LKETGNGPAADRSGAEAGFDRSRRRGVVRGFFLAAILDPFLRLQAHSTALLKSRACL
jgi:hypothetical protein